MSESWDFKPGEHKIYHPSGDPKASQEALEAIQKADAETAFAEDNTREAQKLSRIDTLTELPNRRAFDEEAKKAIDLYHRETKKGNAKPISMVVVDIDYFKKINDTYGHAGGDAVLKSVASALEKRLRSSDRIARWGGEEFGLILYGDDQTAAVKTANALREVVSGLTTSFDKKEIQVTASFGVTVVGPDDLMPTQVFARADEALYRAKEAGRNRVESNP